ncbi:MAG: UDP-glucose/GDP-mannose dehydrogenase family protein [Planctomycetes bacterium]|nr:UDP-glucose/GDP-mannose dehydrogenase family protein [Planctomycetota bacterium]
MKISVIGTGYVGLVAGACFADTGNDVICIDHDANKIARLQRGEIPFFEPGLGELVAHNVAEGRLSFTTDLASGVAGARVAFIAVGTPMSDDGEADLRAVKDVARAIAQAMTGPMIIVNKSTVPVGTNRLLRGLIRETARYPLDIVSNPEFLKEGAAIEDFMKPDRVVIGTDSPEAAEVMRDIYAPFVRTGKPILEMDPESAEVSKYAANSLLATKITFMNEVARICEVVGADVSKVRQGIGSDARIGHQFLFPGVGYGGSCFPKDIRAFTLLGRRKNAPLQILEVVERVNSEQKRLLAQKVVRRFGEKLQGRVFAIWGLAFKPKTDDMREAPSLVVIDELLARGARVRAFDPEARKTAAAILGDRIEITERPYEALAGASALLALTEWNEFRRPDFDRIKSLLEEPVIFDGRNMYDAARVMKLGFEYYGIGVRDSAYE